jgi:hypothetical protein
MLRGVGLPSAHCTRTCSPGSQGEPQFRTGCVWRGTAWCRLTAWYSALALWAALQQWETAQERRATNAKYSRRNNTKNNYLLRSMVTCECQRSLCGCENGGKIYYRCYRASTSLDKETCRRKSIRADLLEPKVWEVIVKLITDPVYLNDRLAEARRIAQENSAPKQRELEHVEAMIKDVDKEMSDTVSGRDL